jgi:tRNA(Ile)-lysidine synthase
MNPDGHPLLALRRHETRRLCDALSIHPTDDPTNADPEFRRNRVRHELLPLIDSIAERDVTPLLVRSAGLLGDDDRLLTELARTIDPCDALAITAAPLPLARRAIREWLSVDGYPPDAAAIARVLDVARGVRTACEVAGVGRVQRSHQRLSVERNQTGAPP